MYPIIFGPLFLLSVAASAQAADSALRPKGVLSPTRLSPRDAPNLYRRSSNEDTLEGLFRSTQPGHSQAQEAQVPSEPAPYTHRVRKPHLATGNSATYTSSINREKERQLKSMVSEFVMPSRESAETMQYYLHMRAHNPTSRGKAGLAQRLKREGLHDDEGRPGVGTTTRLSAKAKAHADAVRQLGGQDRQSLAEMERRIQEEEQARIGKTKQAETAGPGNEARPIGKKENKTLEKAAEEARRKAERKQLKKERHVQKKYGRKPEVGESAASSERGTTSVAEEAEAGAEKLKQLDISQPKEDLPRPR